MSQTAYKPALIQLDPAVMTVDELRATAGMRTAHHLLAQAFRRRGMNDEQVTTLLACALNLPLVSPDLLCIDPKVSKLIPLDMQERYRVVPLHFVHDDQGTTLYAAMQPETAAAIAHFLTRVLGISVVPVAASMASIMMSIDIAAGIRPAPDRDAPHACDLDLDTPVSVYDTISVPLAKGISH